MEKIENEKIFYRISIFRKNLGLSQKDFSELINIPLRNLQNYEAGKTENIPHVFLDACVRKFRCNANWILTGEGLPDLDTQSKKFQLVEDFYADKFDIIRKFCNTDEEFNEIIEQIFVRQEEFIEKIIARKLVDNILKIKSEMSYVKKATGFVAMNGLGAIVALYAIFANATKESDSQPAKEVFLDYCDTGKFSIPQGLRTRSILRQAISDLDDPICEFIYENKKNFLVALEVLEERAGTILKNNANYEEKILSIINFFKIRKR